ncbi:MAG: phosphoadenosine phosphosulfate reductase family protein [Eggerthellaceae bacterium]|nr:phosphoadenosine phosphosulfate reductase family protein [Eggerthellaceae bacterium]
MACGSVTYEDMKRRQSFPLDLKIRLTQARISEWHHHWGGEIYLSFSGGQDSTVLLDIAKGLLPNIPAVYCDTGLESPEVRELALRKADVIIRPEKSFKSVIEEYGYPVPSKEQALFIRQARHSTEHMRGVRLGDGRYSVSDRWRCLVDAPFEVSE